MIQRIMSKFCIFIINNRRFDTPSSSGSICKKLGRTTTIHRTELCNRFVDSPSSCQETVVLEDNRVVISKLLRDTFTFVLTEDNAAAPEISVPPDMKNRLIDSVIMPKSTSILGANVQLDSQCTESLAGNTVCVTSGNDIRSGSMNRTVNHKSRSIDSMQIPTFTDFSVLIHEDKIGNSDTLERFENGIDPEMIGFDGIADRNMARSAFIAVSLLTHPAEGLM